ncbi:hypothetical protein GPECTOR_8g130 [Gonium pectorale]|uniref:Protein kinase domain-containing protein n=1 Tax=Gonium pectorale TaxID=33097 RepID=A0A150GSS1_GONPE|nr:hypothetical protein GPECTOR_8g130 [Gonium pectorale]|eukprot:KXZ52738.1 hypothetical protein GPECTOR_8g130 [Gonium pectorale]
MSLQRAQMPQDFGLARLRTTTVPTVTPGAGTPAYLAPECYDAANHVITHRSDIYSLSILLWEMLAGERPWADCLVMELGYKVVRQGRRPPLDALDEERCPLRLRNLIQQCWEGDPRRRPAAAEMVKCLALVQQAGRVGQGRLRVLGDGRVRRGVHRVYTGVGP